VEPKNSVGGVDETDKRAGKSVFVWDVKLLVSEAVMSHWLMYFSKFLEENGASTGSSMGNGNQTA
jgi:hypothetical protein